jgi:hypothetical protein
MVEPIQVYFYQNQDAFKKLFGISIAKSDVPASASTVSPQSASNPCLNGGKMVNGKCICPKEYFGARCESLYTSLNSCQNRGDPIFDKNNNFRECKCDPGFVGKNCEYESEVCNNRGDPISVDNLGNFECKCDPGFFGKTCQYSKETCGGRGDPVLDENKNFLKCQCDPTTGYAGKYCQYGKEECNERGNPTIIDEKTDRVIECECMQGYAGKNCQYSRDMCKNRGNPVTNKDDEMIGCMCDDRLRYGGKYCCDVKYLDEVRLDKCTGNASCNFAQPESKNGGWTIETGQKTCMQIDRTSPFCSKSCTELNLDSKHLQCSNSIPYCYGDIDEFKRRYPGVYQNMGNPFLNAIYLPPNEFNDLNRIYWQSLSADKDLQTLFPQFDKSKTAVNQLISTFGAFFCAYKFKDTSSDPNEITNRDLVDAITNTYNGRSVLGFDNFGNVFIYDGPGRTNKTVKKSFKNPAFPSKYRYNYPIDKMQVECNGIKGKYFWGSDNKCYNFDSNNFEKLTNEFPNVLKDIQNPNVITSWDRKWILAGIPIVPKLQFPTIPPVNPPTPLPLKTRTQPPTQEPKKESTQAPVKVQYYLLYNPIHTKAYKKFYDKLPSLDEKVAEDKNFLLRKYCEITATKDSKPGGRNYGDPTCNCTTEIDCVNDILQRDGKISKGGLAYYFLFNQCVCGTDAKRGCSPERVGQDSFITQYRKDKENRYFENKQCPPEIQINNCITEMQGAGERLVIDNSTIQNKCGGVGPGNKSSSTLNQCITEMKNAGIVTITNSDLDNACEGKGDNVLNINNVDIRSAAGITFS